jgi:hypothetical protein
LEIAGPLMANGPGDPVGVSDLRVQRVGNEHHVVESAQPGCDLFQQRCERRDFVGLRGDLDLGQDHAVGGVVGRLLVDLPAVG